MSRSRMKTCRSDFTDFTVSLRCPYKFVNRRRLINQRLQRAIYGFYGVYGVFIHTLYIWKYFSKTSDACTRA